MKTTMPLSLSCLKISCAIVMACGFLRLFASEIAFTGSAGSDLSVAANWDGGTLPAAADTGVVDCSTFTGGGTLAIGNDLALGGLKIRNATSSLSLEGSGTLSLGAAGLGVDTNVTIDIRVPVVVTAESTWTFNRGAVNLRATLGGTAALTFNAAGAVSVYTPLGYDGDIVIYSYGLRFYTAGKMAKTLVCRDCQGDNQSNYVSVNAGGTIRWSDVWTGGKFEYTAWRRLYVAATNNATEAAYITMDDPQDDFYQHGPYRSGLASGILDQRAGYLHASNYGIAVGSFEVGTGAALNAGRFPVEYRLSGGSNDVCYIFLGENAKYFNNNPVVKQSGGLSKIRKGIYIGSAVDSGILGFGEYQLSGGSLYVSDGTVAPNGGSDHQTRGLVLNHSFGNAGSCAGVFTQTGGTNTVWTVKFGPDTRPWGEAVLSQHCVNSGFGLFDFRGGVLNFASTPFTFGAGWNTTATNAAYRINVSGGTMNFKDGQKIAAQIELPPSETTSEWNVASGVLTVDAPVSGLGTLKKTGAGQIFFNNMNRFNGTLKIASGVAKISGEAETDNSFDTESDTCWIWTADSFNATHTNNQDVASWADDRHGVPAVDWTNSSSTFYSEWLKDPTFSQNGKTGLIKGYPKHLPVFVTNAYFNGHSSIQFNQTILQVPAAQNPIAGATNLTIAIVYREANGGGSNPWYGTTVIGGSDYYYGGIDLPILTHDGSNRAWFSFVSQRDGKEVRNEKQGVTSRSGKNLQAKTNVAVLTIDGNDYSLNVNGFATNAVLSGSAVRPMFRHDNNAMPLNFGGHFPDSANFSSGNAYVAEIRIYRDRSFTNPEKALLARKLMMKYIGTSGETEFFTELNSSIPAALNGETAPDVPTAADREWTADTANALADGAEVTSLASVDGGTAATTALADSAKGPTLVKGFYNGHSALRFSSADKTALGVANADLVGKNGDFALAVVFATKTDAPAASAATFSKSSGVGIVAQDLSASGGHLGFTWHHEGTLLAGYGGSWFVYRRPFRLNDGLPHVAVFSRDASGNYVWMIDGHAETGTTTDRSWNTSAGNFLLGRIAKGQDAGYFDGDLLAVRLYDSALTKAQAKTLSEYYAYTYGFRLLGCTATAEDVSQNGFGRTMIEVDADAQLMLPNSQTAPFTITAANGRSLKVAGQVLGSVRYADGGVLDVSEGLPDIEDLQLADGAVLKIGAKSQLPVDLGGVAQIGGVIDIDATALAQPNGGASHTTVFTGVDASTLQSGTGFTVSGLGKTARAELVDGTVTILQFNGTLLIFR